MAVAYKNQWGTLHVLFRARKALTQSQVVDLLGPSLAKGYGTTQKPALWTKKVAFDSKMVFDPDMTVFEGIAKPYKMEIGSSDADESLDRFRLTMMQNGEPDPTYANVLHAVKWNVRRRDKRAFVKGDGGEARDAIRKLFNARRFKMHLDGIAFQPYGVAPTFLKMPVPKTPALPKQPVKPAPEPVVPLPVAKKTNPWGYIFAALAAAKLIAG